MSYLVDANVLREATRPQVEPKVLAWLERHDAELEPPLSSEDAAWVDEILRAHAVR